MKYFSFLILFFGMCIAQAQELQGKVFSEDATPLGGILVKNMNTDETTASKSDGSYHIKASKGDIVRFIHPSFEREEKKVGAEHLETSVEIVLFKKVMPMEEVVIDFRPTGNLKKDAERFKKSKKQEDLERNLANSLKFKPQKTNEPRLTAPKDFSPNYSEGQVNVVAIAAFAYSLMRKATKPKPEKATYSEKMAFQKRVKEELDFSFFRKYSEDEYELETFIAYCDEVRQLSKLYRKNFNINKIQFELEDVFKTYKDRLKPGAS